MSIVIIGGNECMERDYKNLCRKHGCHAKVFCKYKTSLCERIGNPDMMVVFTHTASHKMVQTALGSVGNNTLVVRSHTSSMNSLQKILEENVK